MRFRAIPDLVEPLSTSLMILHQRNATIPQITLKQAIRTLFVVAIYPNNLHINILIIRHYCLGLRDRAFSFLFNH